jgi:hypothetical protein
MLHAAAVCCLMTALAASIPQAEAEGTRAEAVFFVR